MILHDIPADEKAVIFMSGGDDPVKMKELFGDAAGYYCSENNARYGKKLDSLEDCIKDRMLQKRFLFTTKAIGMGIEIKDRTLKQSISPYRMPVLVDWIKEHLNQPMKWKDLYTGIMISKVFAEHRNRPIKPTTLNKKLAIYGVQAVRGRDKKKQRCAILVLGRVLNIVRFGARSVIFLHIIMTNVAPEYKSDVKAAV